MTRDVYPQIIPIRCPEIVFFADAILADGFVASRKAVGPSDGKIRGCLSTNARTPSVSSKEPVIAKEINESLNFLFILILGYKVFMFWSIKQDN